MRVKSWWVGVGKEANMDGYKLQQKVEGRYDGARGDYDFSPQDVQTVKG